MTIDILDEDGASNIAHPEIYGKPNKTQILSHLEKSKKMLVSTPSGHEQHYRHLLASTITGYLLTVGSNVNVDFISESSTEHSGQRFIGLGVIDRIEDGRLFGRLMDGRPFLCFPSDVTVLGEKA
ncbi:hypothetical protein [Acinetobacter sp. NIPH 298]|uniref:hypothetical protein n=1 Tax=Acinetobacter sp. NIPH 298 TaxID=1217692 RepID=UPI0002D049D1|nr:hypothetical protein [Acinetobacter sp. NIPH 298]ENW95942.1 hypothetical protein F903_01710 [Acinetobacter sp. NIPH 298]